MLLRLVRGEEAEDLDAALCAAAEHVDGEVAEVVASLPGLPRPDRRREAARALRLLREAQPAPPAPGRSRERRPTRRGRAGAGPMPADPMERPVQSLAGIGPRGAEALRGQQVHTVGDLLELIPRRYEDRRRVVTVAEIEEGRPAVLDATVARCRVAGPPRQRRIELVVESGEARVDVVFFHARPGMAARFAPGTRVRLAGTPRRRAAALQLAHPEVVAVGDDARGPGNVAARYPPVRGIARKVLARAVDAALELPVDDVLPEPLRARLDLPDRRAALFGIHRPSREIDAKALAALRAGRSPGHRFLAAEELFLHEVVAAQRRAEEGGAEAPALADSAAATDRLAGILPFALTGAQRRVLAEIHADLARSRPMRRLLQGDVGSGKTVVALGAILSALDAGRQAALMAPTELLALQHARTLAPWLDALGHRLALLLGSQASRVRKRARHELEVGSAGLAIGTHALLTASVEVPRLALCVVDEQHRFGVAQRLRLVEKGRSPHLLVMTATPIPRTLALALHGDLSLAVLDERPEGRTPPVTSVHPPEAREAVLCEVGRALAAGERGFVVCPLVEESEELDQSAAVPLHEELEKRFRGHRIALVHGRLGPEEKAQAMEAFADGRAQLLVATTIVEVGIDVPDASFVVVDGAERFGLSQLHQIRGRVGRGGGASRCFLVHGAVTPEVAERLRAFAGTDDGFRVAEIDLERRGPGDLAGLRQSGLIGLAFADPLRDLDLLLPARDAARALVAGDANLEEHPALARAVRRRWPGTGRPVREEAG